MKKYEYWTKQPNYRNMLIRFVVSITLLSRQVNKYSERFREFNADVCELAIFKTLKKNKIKTCNQHLKNSNFKNKTHTNWKKPRSIRIWSCVQLILHTSKLWILKWIWIMLYLHLLIPCQPTWKNPRTI